MKGLLNTKGRWPLLLRLTNRLISTQEALHELRAGGPSALDDSQRSLTLTTRNGVPWPCGRPSTLPPPFCRRAAESLSRSSACSPRTSPFRSLWSSACGPLPVDSLPPQDHACCARNSRACHSFLCPRKTAARSILRDYLRGELPGADLVGLHSALTDTIAAGLPPAQPLANSAPAPVTAWRETEHGYVLDHLMKHCLAGGHEAEADAEFFSDETVAAAMIDRLVYHAEVHSLKGDSYRMAGRARRLGRVPHRTRRKRLNHHNNRTGWFTIRPAKKGQRSAVVDTPALDRRRGEDMLFLQREDLTRKRNSSGMSHPGEAARPSP